MKISKYLENYTTIVKDTFFDSNESEIIVSTPNKCFLALKTETIDNLIKFLADHDIINLESTFHPDDYHEFPAANIGFSKSENKWYGWSHRAIWGFTVGDSVKKGDCAYRAKNKEDYIQQSIDFWKDEDHLNMHVENITDKGFTILWTYSDNIPNEKIRGEEGGIEEKFPEEFGRGEWTAETLEDAKQMAIDFANNVS